MARYSIVIKKSAVKDLERIPKKVLRLVVKRIQSLADDPRPAGAKKLSRKERYRLHQGRYRIVYSVHDERRTVRIVKISHRYEVYR